jgi:predicted DNA-binding protein YlxM (UPF0122 family)
MTLKGYSFKFVKANQEADASKIGVLLGRYCIMNDIPVSAIAETFDVSRMTVYQWFIGASNPHRKKAEKIKELLDRAVSN